jgi:hypothetical protein
MSAARLNSRALTVRGTLPQIGSFSLVGPGDLEDPHWREGAAMLPEHVL